MMTRLLALAFIWFAYGCQTLAPMPQSALPPQVTRLFGACSPADGAVMAQVYTGDGLRGSAQVDWVARSYGIWETEVTDPIGGTALALKRQNATIRASGHLANRVPPLTVGDDGWITVDGTAVALKADEIPCLLHFVFPKPWLDEAVSTHYDGPIMTVSFADPGRSMTLTLPPLGSPDRPCVRITWRHHLILSHELDWCRTATTGSLAGAGDFMLKWTALDER